MEEQLPSRLSLLEGYLEVVYPAPQLDSRFSHSYRRADRRSFWRSSTQRVCYFRLFFFYFLGKHKEFLDAKPLTIQQPTGSLFGTATAPQPATSSLFSATASTATTNAAAPFGAPAATAPAAGGGLFSGQPQPTATSAAPSSLFGAPAAATGQTATAPLFGTNTAAAPATTSAASLFQLPGTGGASTGELSHC